MPAVKIDEYCRGESLRDIINYNCPCPPVCSCLSKTHKNRRRRRQRRKKCKVEKVDKACPQRIEEISRPTNRKVQNTLELYAKVFDSERVVKMCRLVHELANPQPKPTKLVRSRRRSRIKKTCKTKKVCAKWLEAQLCKSSGICINYLKCLRKIVPNYKQLQVTVKLYKYLNFRKVPSCNRYVKDELKALCQKLAILIDTKLEPYKQGLVIETLSVSTLEDKHCVFKMFEMEREEELEEEEEESVVSSLFGMQSITEFAEELELEELEVEEYELEEEYMQEEEGGLIAEELSMEEVAGSLEEDLGGMLADEIVLDEEMYQAEEESMQVEKEQEEGKRDSKKSADEGIGIHRTTSKLKGAEEEVTVPAAFEEEESVMEAVSEEAEEAEEEEEAEGMLDYHLDGTSSYVDWCLYVSWLKELGSNIEMYANCLQNFRKALGSDNPSKYQDSLRYLLKNWTNYLSDSRKVDSNMTQYFKDKPMTWCTHCRDCSIDDYPALHYIPPELDQTIKTTKQWRRLLAEAEEYCRAICAEGKEEGEAETEESDEIYEIHDVGSSTSSSFDVEILPQDNLAKPKNQ